MNNEEKKKMLLSLMDLLEKQKELGEQIGSSEGALRALVYHRVIEIAKQLKKIGEEEAFKFRFGNVKKKRKWSGVWKGYPIRVRFPHMSLSASQHGISMFYQHGDDVIGCEISEDFFDDDFIKQEKKLFREYCEKKIKEKDLTYIEELIEDILYSEKRINWCKKELACEKSKEDAKLGDAK